MVDNNNTTLNSFAQLGQGLIQNQGNGMAPVENIDDLFNKIRH